MSSLKHELEKLAREVGLCEDAKRLAIEDAGKTRKLHAEVVDPLVAKVAALQNELGLAEANRRAEATARGMAEAELVILEAVLDDAAGLLHRNKIRFDKDAARVEKAASMAKVAVKA